MKDVSVLGCGWLGKPLAISLLKKDFSIKGSTTSLEKLKTLQDLEIEPFLVDISSDKNFTNFLSSDILIVAITSKEVDAFKKLMQQIESSTIKKVIFISSTSVYPNLNQVMNEDNETLDTPLFQIEELFRNNQKFETTIIRFAGLFGNNRNPGNWFKNGRRIPNPEGFVNMIHQDDCIAIIEEIIKQNYWNTTFNACSNHHPTRREFYTNAKLKLGLETPDFKENETLQYKIINSDKVQEKLNYQFKHDNLLEL